jgi:hypothetical protein
MLDRHRRRLRLGGDVSNHATAAHDLDLHLRTLAERGYEGAASADHNQQAQVVGLFITDTIACLDRQE